MDYDLAKRLKDAGFVHDWDKDYVPSLEELIDAVDKTVQSKSPWYGFYLYSQIEDLDGSGVERIWSAVLTSPGKIEDKGKTPTEAVALLWLKLNDNE